MDLSSTTNTEFISSKEASLLTGYVSDYITRQCRLGKIKSEQRGRVWVIEKGSLLRYFAEEEKRKQENAQLLARAREEEYRQAQKEREKREVVPSPYVPAGVPFVWHEEGARREVRGSSTALALTMMLLSFGLYLGHEQVRAEVVTALRGVGEKTITFVESGVEATLSLRVEEKPHASVIAVLPKHFVPEISLNPALGFANHIVARVPEFKKPSAHVSKEASVDSRTAKSVLEAGAWVGKGLKNISNTILATYAYGVEKWVVVTPEIPPKIISFVGDVGYRIASVTNSAPTHVATSLGGLENTVLGVVGNIALAYDTTKENLVQAYHYAPGAKLAVVRESITKEQEAKIVRALAPEKAELKLAEVAKVALGTLRTASGGQVATAHVSGARSFFEGMALGTYEGIQGIFRGVSRTIASLFVSKEKVVALTPDTKEAGEQKMGEEKVVVIKQELETSRKEVSTPIYSGGNVYNQYTTVTATGVSKEYVEERIKLHIDNLDDRVDERIDRIDSEGGGGGGSGSVTSVDASGGTTGFSFSGGPITSSGTLTLSGFLNVANGGTGTSTAPSYGQVLLGNSLGGYDLVATSSLGITGSGSVLSGTTGQFPYYASNSSELTATSSLFLATTGYVGVGTTSPEAPLHVTSQSHGGLLVESLTGWANYEMRSAVNGADYRSRFELSATDGTFQFRVGQGSAGVNGSDDAPLRITTGGATSGLVGIGHVGSFGTGNPTSRLQIDNSTSGATAGTKVLTILGDTGQTANLTEWQNSSGATFSAVNPSGWFGIGTTSPFSKLSVHANNGETNTTLFAIGSSTASATSTLFSVNNIGALRIGSSITYTNTDNQNIFSIIASGGTITLNPNNGSQLYYSGFGTRLRSTGGYLWDNNATVGNGTVDTGLMRISAGTVGISTGTAGNFTGNLVAERIGLGTSTPYAQLSIVATSTNGVGAPTTLFAIASTTAGTATSTLFSINNYGSVGVGTAPELAAGRVAASRFTASDTNGGFVLTASADIGSGANGANPTVRLRNDGGFIWSSSFGLSTPDTGIWRQAAGVVRVGNGTSANSNGWLSAERIGLGTTSPYAQLSVVATSTNGVGAPTTLFSIASSSQGTATSTLLSVSNTGTLSLPLLGTPAGAFLAVDANGGVIATTTPGGASYTFAYPLVNSLSTISLAFGTTTSNTWAGTQTFTYASTTGISAGYASSTSGFFGSLFLPLLGTPAGTFLAVDGSGQVIATSSGGSSQWTTQHSLLSAPQPQAQPPHFSPSLTPETQQ